MRGAWAGWATGLTWGVGWPVDRWSPPADGEPLGWTVCVAPVGLPPSTRALPSCPNQVVQADMIEACSSGVSPILPP